MKDINRFAGIIIKYGDEVLLGKRNVHKSLPGEWSIPAGHLHEGEEPIHAAKRETFEETNIKIDGKLKLVGFINRHNREGKKNKGLMYVFLYESDEKLIPNLKQAKDGKEHSEMKYFSLKNLPFNDKSDQLCEIITRILKKD
jgi:ADP-ribose pyrophosphatase YjhB (NUDIX family)